MPHIWQDHVALAQKCFLFFSRALFAADSGEFFGAVVGAYGIYNNKVAVFIKFKDHL